MYVRSVPSRMPAHVGLLPLVSLVAGLSCAPSPDPAGPAAPTPWPEPPRASMPASLRAAFLQARQCEAGPEYRVQSRGTQVTAENIAHRLAVTLDAHGVHLRHTATDGLGSLRLYRAGCADSPQPVPAVAPHGQGARVTYLRPGLVEWYLNGPLGLEQGFTLAEDAGCGRRVLELQLDGTMTAQLVGSGAAARVELQDPASGRRIYYSDLFAHDAHGNELPTRLALVAQTIRLEVVVTGAHYPIEVDPLLWTEQQKLSGSDGAAQDNFGRAVAVSGNTAVIGAAGKTVAANAAQGQAYVYVRSGNTWTEQQKLTASDGAAGDNFGFAVAVSGDTAVVGAYQKKVGANVTQGQAYIYVRAGTVWSEQQKLIASDGTTLDAFGAAVAVSGDTALVGAYHKKVGANLQQGQTYVYVRAGTVWSEQQKLTAADGATNDTFGNAVAISGDTTVVGANQKTVGANAQQGKTYVYVRSGIVWSEQQKLIASDGAANDTFGNSVAVSGDTAVVGALAKQIGANTSQGQAYVYVRSGTVWSEQQKLLASDGASGDAFGGAVAISGDTVLVGASTKKVGANAQQGQAYFYVRAGTTWSQQQKLIASDGAASDLFGAAVAVSGDTAVVGAYLKQLGAKANQGQAYVLFQSGLPSGAQCAGPGDCASGFCVTSICCDAACGGGTCATGRCTAADLSLAVAGTPTRGIEPASFVVQLDNFGPSPADSVSVLITLPSKAPLISVTAPGWTCVPSDSQVLCTLPSAVAGPQTPIVLRLQAPYSEPTITVSAQVSTTNPDPGAANNRATATVSNDNPVNARFLGGGLGGCSTSGARRPGAGWGVVLLALSALALRRRSVRGGVALLALSLGCSAQEYGPAITPEPADSELHATLPASLRAAYLQARQQEAGPEYRVQRRGGQVVADNAVHRLAVAMDARGVHLRHTAASGQSSLRLVRAGCATQPEPVPPVDPTGQGTRVTYVRRDLTEWYGKIFYNASHTNTHTACTPHQNGSW